MPAGATGNVATEDVVSMLHEMGVQTGIDLRGLLKVSRAVQYHLGRPLGSHTLVAGPGRLAPLGPLRRGLKSVRRPC